MTLAELSKYHNIKIELNDIRNRIKEIESTLIKSTTYSDTKTISVSNNSNPVEETVIQLNKLKTKYEDKVYDLINEQLKIENYLDSISDSEIREIIRYRFIDCMTWNEIAVQLNYSRTNPYIKLRNYLRIEKMNAIKESTKEL